MGRVEPVPDVRGRPDPDRPREVPVERPGREPRRRLEGDRLRDRGDPGVGPARRGVARRGRVGRPVAAVDDPVFRERSEEGSLDGRRVGLTLEAGVLAAVVRDPERARRSGRGHASSAAVSSPSASDSVPPVPPSSSSAIGTVTTGTGEIRTTFSVTLPSSTRRMPLRV